MTETPGPGERRNYALHLVGGGFLFVALQFGSTRLVVPWIGVHLGVAYVLVAAILPAVQLGLIAGQLGSAPYFVRTRMRRKAVVGAGLMLAMALAIVFVATNSLPPLAAAVVLLACMVGFGVNHGAFNVGYEDLLAKTIPSPRRGPLTAHRAAIGGAATVLIALVILQLPEVQQSHDDVLWLGVAGWLGVVGAYALLREPASDPKAQPFAWSEFLRGLNLIGAYPWYRRLLIANVLLLSVELAIPFYAIHAATLHDPTAQNVTLFVLTSSVGVLLSGLWAKVPIRSRIVAGALLAALAGTLTFLVQATGPWQVPYFYAGLFVLLTLGEQGSIQGRMTYLANHASDRDRPAMVATSSTTGWIVGIGLAALLAMAGQFQDIRLPLVILIATNLAAALCVFLLLDPDD